MDKKYETPASLKISRELIRFHKIHDGLARASVNGNEELCAELYKVFSESNNKLIELLGGEQ